MDRTTHEGVTSLIRLEDDANISDQVLKEAEQI
jgi:hypothetical protein